MGLVRFREWINEEGRPESGELLRCYEDMKAYERLAEEVRVCMDDTCQVNHQLTTAQAVTQGMQAVYGNLLRQE